MFTKLKLLGALTLAALASAIAMPSVTEAAPVAKQPVAIASSAPKVVDFGGKLGKYRVTTETVNGQQVVHANKITKKAHAAAGYLHAENASGLCIAWNNQSAVANLQYVELSLGRPYAPIGSDLEYSIRTNPNSVEVDDEWFELLSRNPPGAPIHQLYEVYACRVLGTDAAMTMYSVWGGSVQWRWV